MINLNLNEVTTVNILKYISDYDIFNYYIPEFEVNASFNSPLRKDEIPSFSVFYSRKYSNLLYHDFSTGETGDCFMFVMKLLCLSYPDALEQIILDFGLQDKFIIKQPKLLKAFKTNFINKTENKFADIKRSKINVKVREWTAPDLDFWRTFGINEGTLVRHWVFPITTLFVNGYTFPTKKYSYTFIEYKDNVLTYKVYQPFNTNYKWITNHPYGVHQGYKQLPKTGDLMIITKSLKDVMSLYDVAHIPAIGVQSETCFVKDSVMDEYKERFKKVIVLFDNDKAGINSAKKYNEKYNVPYITLPNPLTKDFSDLVAREGAKEAVLTLNKLL